MFDLTWGTFGKVHIATLVFAVLINVALFLILKKFSRKKQILILLILSFAGIAGIVYNMLVSKSIYESLPLHLWSLNALILPFAVLFRSKWSCNLLLLWSIGSYFPLVFNMGRADMDVLSWSFAFFYAAHIMGAGIPLLLFALKLVDSDFRTMKYSLSITALIYTLVHFINVAINSANITGPAGEIINVNYLSTIVPSDRILKLFYLVIPSPYWYMLLAIPVVLIYFGWLYLPELLDYRRRLKKVKSKVKAIDEYYEEYEEEYIEEIIEEKY